MSEPNSPGNEGYLEFNAAETALAADEGQDGEAAPPPKAKKMGGWADEKPKGRSRDRGEEAYDERLTMTEMKGVDDDDDDDEDDDDNGGDDGIPAIPNLEQAEREDLTMQIAEAPSQNIAVTSFDALEKGLETSMPFAITESGIDLKLLTKELSNVDAIIEADETWDFEHLFTEVKSQLQLDQEEEDDKASEPKSPKA